MSDDDRRRILERRQRFLSAAVGATAGMLLSGCDQGGAACHSARRNLPRSVARAVGCVPSVCLSIAVVDAGAAPAPAPAPAPRDGGGADGADGNGEP
ncbi:MAG: hypothetical protein IPI67_37445 [Myxococcales bacterium]|nr:hypothetical protein [Myxococcales bacterium]